MTYEQARAERERIEHVYEHAIGSLSRECPVYCPERNAAAGKDPTKLSGELARAFLAEARARR